MTGQLLNCYHPFEFSVTGIAQWLIRKITGGADHTAIIMENVGDTHVIEASYEMGGVVIFEYNEWVDRHPGVRYTVSSPMYNRFIERDFKHLLKDQIGKKYDVNSLLWHMLWYQITKKYRGQTDNGSADNEFFCSELAMFVHKRDDWFMMTPADVERHPDFDHNKTMISTSPW